MRVLSYSFTFVLRLGWLWALFGLTDVKAQTTLTGTTRDAAGQPIEGVIVEAETNGQPPANAFVLTDAQGAFRLTLSAGEAADSLRLSARALGYATQLRRLLNRSQTVELRMREEATKLKEVTVRGAPITRQGDTLNYSVGAFATKKDRVISDVLKKMPGIEVAGDGQISFEGNPISKFYVNGQDLLESRYNLASDNLPADAVQSVQVLQNHQPVRALADRVRPESAAINIKLKKQMTATGQARLGVGLVPSPMGALYEANLSPMLFTKKQQLIDTYQGNNTGQDVAAALKPLTIADLRQFSEGDSRKPDLTRVQGVGQPPVAASRYLFNQVQLLSANHLINVGPENQLRVNASYLHDQQRQLGGSRTLFFLPDGRTVSLTEDTRNDLRFNTLQTDLAFIKNVKRYYLKNTLSLEGRWDSQTGSIAQQESGLRVGQAATNPFFGVTNRLGLVRPLAGGRTLQVNSLVFVNNSPQRLAVSPGVFAGALTGGAAYDTARQAARLASFYTQNSVGLSGSRRAWSYGSALGFSTEIQRLTSRLETAPVPSTAGALLENNLDWAKTKTYLQPSLSYKKEDWNASLELPLSYYDLRATDRPLSASQRLNALVAEPSVSARRDLGALWYASGSAGLSTRFGDISQLNYGYILDDYRTLTLNAAPLARAQTQRYSAGLYFKDPLKSLFFSTSYSLSSTLSNRLYSSQVSAIGALLNQALNQDNRSLTQALYGNVSKFISPWKTNLSLSWLASLNRQPRLLNGLLTEARTRSGTLTLKANCAAFDWGSLDYSASLTGLRSLVEGAAPPPLTVLQDHHASLSVFGTRHQATLAADYYASRGPAAPVQAVFADLTYRYTLPTARKMDLELRWNNVFDTRQYQYGFVSAFQLVQSTYQLRPAQVLALLRVSL